MTILKEKLNEAFENKKNDINSFIWKGKKIKCGNNFIQDEIKLVNASDSQLKEFYDHCNTMLYNNSKKYPGRYLVLSVLEDQQHRCKAEIALRKFEDDGFNRNILNDAIQKELAKDSRIDPKDLTFKDIANVEADFADIPLNLIIDGCVDKLGVFNRKYLKLAFILKQGIWLTKQEMLEFSTNEMLDNNIKIVDAIKDRLNINPNIELKISSTGLSFTQFRAMLQLKNKKYSEMTTDQLKTLRNRILFNLMTEVKMHIKQWEIRKDQIKMVADYKGIDLD